MFASRWSAVALSVVTIVAVGCSPAVTNPPAPAVSPVVTPGAPAPEAATSNPVVPTFSATPAAGPDQTPIAILDGEPWIVYNWPRVGKDGKWAIFLMRPDGSDAHEIAADVPGEHRAPAWSPDGSRLAFVVKDADHPEGWIWTASADGSGAAALSAGVAECPVGMFHPAWSPDGTRLAVVCYPNGDDHESVAIVDPAAGTVVRLADFTHPDAVDSPPTWSPDGGTVAFEILHYDPTNTSVEGSVVATVPVAGGQVHRLTSPDRFMGHPDWRPDGTELVMSGSGPTSASPTNLFVIRPDGTGLSQLTQASTDGHLRIETPRWTPDGDRILVSLMYTTGADYEFGGEVQLASVEATGGDPVVISTQTSGKYPDLRPTP